jgi:hypothetical protein
MDLIARWERYLPGLLALMAGALYALTMAPTIGHTDSGELSAVAYTFGVAHPTGYPLFTLLGWLWTRIPLGSVAMRLNVMCWLFMAGGVYVWASFVRGFFLRMRTSARKQDSSSVRRIQAANLTGTIAGTLVLSFGRTWWFQSTSVEVYSLQCLLMAVFMWTMLKAWYAEQAVFRSWAAIAVALALCFTNHLTAIALLPGVLYMFFARFGFKLETLRLGLGLAGIGFGVLSLLYGMMMVAAQSHPAYNWGNPEDGPRLWHHISGQQFSTYMFEGRKEFAANLLAYLNRLPGEWGWDWSGARIPVWTGLGLMVVQGMAYLFQRRREWAVFFGLTGISNVFWAANYSIKDPEPYFLLSFFCIAFLGAMSLRWSWIAKGKFAPSITVAFAIMVSLQAAWNFRKTDQRGAWQYEDYARVLLGSLEPNAILVSKSWDVVVGPACYLQGCEGFRKDVTVLDYALLHNRHWYPMQLRTQDPELAVALGDRLDEWEKAVMDFDIRHRVNTVLLTACFSSVYTGILSQLAMRPVYITSDVFDAIGSREIEQPPLGIVPVPDRYAVRLRFLGDAQAYAPMASLGNEIRFGGDEEEYECQLLKTQLGRSWTLRADYERRMGHLQEAQYLEAAAKALHGKQPRE